MSSHSRANRSPAGRRSFAEPVGEVVALADYLGPSDEELAAIERDEHDRRAALEAELGWQDRAVCAQTDPEAFFPDKGGSTREAKQVCRGCEVRAECLGYALENDERFGIWGGMSERERRRFKQAVGAEAS